MKYPTPPKESAPLFYDVRGGYWRQISDGSFLPLDSTAARMHMRETGLDPEKSSGDLDEIQRALFVAQTTRCVHYAGPLAGWKPGPFETADGRRVLVTRAARLPVPKSGDCETLERFTGELLGQQATHFCHWLALSHDAASRGSFRPGQMVALCGPAGCGKSLLQHVITAALGGRASNPWKYMAGETAFNADLAESEHWAIEETGGSTDIRTRRKFGEAVKQAVVSRNLFVHPKGQKAIVLPTFRRVTISLNSEVENVLQLPPLDESISDKVNLYRCEHAEVGNDEDATWRAFTSELPAFLHRCRALKVPKPMRCDRYGVKSYHHPALVEILADGAPENRLLTILDETLWGNGNARLEFWTGTAAKLEDQLLRSAFASAVPRLLYYSTACGVYLSRLAAKLPDRFSVDRDSGKAVWCINAP